MRLAGNVPQGSVHFDGSPVRAAKADLLFHLCSLFDDPALVKDDLSNLHSLIRDGPASVCGAHLQPIKQYFDVENAHAARHEHEETARG